MSSDLSPDHPAMEHRDRDSLGEVPVRHLEPVCTRAIRRYARLDALPPLLLVVAPTGYGKTVFLSSVSESLSRGGCRNLLLSLDEGRYDFGRIATDIERLVHCPNISPAMIVYGSSTIEVDARIDHIVQAAAALDEDTVLLLDGFNAERDLELGALIERLALGSPSRLRLVITARELPAAILYRARLQGGTRELGPAELSMEPEEIRQLFANAKTHAIQLTDAQLATIKARTEGWPAAVRLMHIAMSSSLGPAALDVTGGLDTSLTDTLARRVLTAMEPALAHFLLDIADLECFNAELCAYMTQDAQAGQMVADLIRLNLLIFPATGRPGWYRLHNLFRDFLRREAHVSRTVQQRQALLARALQWSRRHGRGRDAFELALLIEDGEQASDLLAQQARQIVQDEGDLQAYINAYEQLLAFEPKPADEARHWYAWALIFARQYEKAYHVVSAMDEAKTGVQRGASRKEALLAVILYSLDRVAEARTHSEAWLAADNGIDPFETSGVACVLVASGVADLDFATARRGLQIARSAMTRTGSEYGLAWISCLEAMVDIEEGESPFDATRLIEAMERARQSLSPISPIISTMEIMAAKIALERSELDLARERILHGLSQAKQHGFVETTKIGLEVAVRLWDGRQDSVFAPQHLAAIAHSFPKRLRFMLDCMVLVRLARLGLYPEAREWVRCQGLEAVLDGSTGDDSAPLLASAAQALLHARIAWLGLLHKRIEALDLIDRALQALSKSGRTLARIRLLLSQASLLATSGQLAQSRKSVTRALGLAAPRGLLQPFIEHADTLKPFVLDDKRTWPLVTDQELDFFAVIRQHIAHATHTEPEPDTVDTGIAGETLTAREMELLGYLEGGLSNQDIADRLGLTVGTIKWHLHNLYAKLQVSNRSAALFKARRAGLIER